MFTKKKYTYKIYSEEVDGFIDIIGSIGCSFCMSKETLESSLRNGQRTYRIFDLRLTTFEFYRLCHEIGKRQLTLKPRA